MSICACVCVLWYLRVSIQQYYPGISYEVDAGMQAVLANKLDPSVHVTLPVPALIRERITYPELRIVVVYVAMLLKGHAHRADSLWTFTFLPIMQ